jgi:myo-inositol-1(or 4)-monophosphatase
MSREDQPEDQLAIAIDVARAAGRLLAEGFAGGAARVLGVRQGADAKTSASDLVTEFDRRSEELIVERLAAAFPRDAVIAEEGGARAGEDARWYVDPLDGTTNFAHGLPFFCVTMARVDARGVELGVIHAPILDLTFSATRGGGAYCNDRRLRVSTEARFDHAMLGTGFPSDRRTDPDTNFPQFEAVKMRARAVRRYGSAAIDQALVAAGTYDGYWEMKLKPWDLAAGALLVAEAGGRATGWLGEPLRLERGAIVSSNGAIHDELVAVLASAGTPDAVR